MAVLGRQGGHRLGGDIGRIAEDQVVALSGERGERIALVEVDLGFQGIVGHVIGGHGQGVGGQVDRVHLGIREGVRHHDGQASGAGAYVGDTGERLGVVDPG